jgi:hypothetical protein
MALKYFTNKNGTSIAINPAHVISVVESSTGGSAIYSMQVEWKVTDSYLDVVARLNEKD